MIMNDDYIVIWKESVVLCSKVLFWHYVRETEEKYVKGTFRS
jgi:hypothetical protein